MKEPITDPSKCKSRVRPSKKKYEDRRRQAFREEAAKRRARDFAVRCPQGDSDVRGKHCRVVPYLHSASLDEAPDVCASVLDFYARCGTDNPYVEVRKGLNIANPDGLSPQQKGLFALVDLASGFLVCLYSGEIYDRCPNWGAYILRVQDSVYIDAEHEKYDVGYLMSVPSHERKYHRTPYNHGRFVNTLFDENLAAGLTYNCEFCMDESGLDVVWVKTLRPIPAGEELLADYGEWYHRKSKLRRK